jgi:hypothetical protein
VPVVLRLEYLVDYLQGVAARADPASLESILAERKRAFETEKYKALGRGRPFSRKLSYAAILVQHCGKMSSQMGFVGRGPKAALSSDGETLLHSPEKIRLDLFASRFLATYEATRKLLLLMNERINKEIVFPTEHSRTEGERFVDLARPSGLFVDVVSFTVIREMLSEVGLINWHPVHQENRTLWKLYLTAEIAELGPKPSMERRISFIQDGRTYVAMRREMTYSEVRSALWDEYMEQTHYIPFRPVFYSDLRVAACHRLRISDRGFDAFAMEFLQRKDDAFEVVWSTGSLPYDRDSASLLKSLPPRMEGGEYVIYLKIKRRAAM